MLFSASPPPYRAYANVILHFLPSPSLWCTHLSLAHTAFTYSRAALPVSALLSFALSLTHALALLRRISLSRSLSPGFMGLSPAARLLVTTCMIRHRPQSPCFLSPWDHRGQAVEGDNERSGLWDQVSPTLFSVSPLPIPRVLAPFTFAISHAITLVHLLP